MNKQYRILNKTTNEDKIYDIDLKYLEEGQTELELLDLYVAGDDPFGVTSFNNYTVIPNDRKTYISADNEAGYELNTEKELNELKQEKILEVENAYTNSFLNGLNSSIGIKLHIKPEDQLNYIGAMIATASLQDSDILPFPMIDFNGVVHKITKGQASTAYLEIVNYKAQMESKRAALFGQIKIVTIDNIEEITW